MTRGLSGVRGHSLRLAARFRRAAAYAAHLGPADTFAIWATVSGPAPFPAFRCRRPRETEQRDDAGKERYDSVDSPHHIELRSERLFSIGLPQLLDDLTSSLFRQPDGQDAG
jgi:hypothetical protein